jgi:ADP-ribosyltransferase exoenzyme
MLTPEQQSAIRDYSDRGYERINRQLRQRAVTDKTRREINILTSALKNLSDFRGDVFRGATIWDLRLLGKYQRVGETITERAFTSACR